MNTIFDNHNTEVPAQKSLLVVKPVNTVIQEAAEAPDPIPLIPGLWNEGEIACLFARTNVGKSIYAVQISAEIAKNQKVLYFDSELSDKQFQLRYTNPDTGEVHRFPENLFRATISRADPYSENHLNVLFDNIGRVASENDIKVLVIDNLTSICIRNEKADEAGIFMENLKHLQEALKMSILVVAHTPKIPEHISIELNHLAGSHRLSSYFDDVFAIGKSAYGPNFKYLKQLKYRASEHTYGEDNVILLETVKQPDGNLVFEKRGCEPEQSQLRPSLMAPEKIEIVKAMIAQGMSCRKIQDQTGISKSAVGRISKAIKKETAEGLSVAN